MTLARTVEIINGYTVTFEDGQYAVNLVGANSNVGDVVNVNQVSVRSANSAGLVTSAAIEFGEYREGVTIDVVNGENGSIYPIGTLRRPVDNVPDAMIIAAARGFSTIYMLGDLTLGSGDDVSDMTIIGTNPTQNLLTIGTDAVTDNLEIHDCTVEGVLDGGTLINACSVEDLTYVNGIVQDCWMHGVVTLGGSEDAVFIKCTSSFTGITRPVIDCGGSGQSLIVSDYNGNLILRNKTGTSDTVQVDMASGTIELQDTLTAGHIYLRGVCASLTDNSDGATVHDDLLNGANISSTLMAITDSGSVSLEDALLIMRRMLENKVTKSGDVVTVFEEDGATQWRQFNLASGQRLPL